MSHDDPSASDPAPRTGNPIMMLGGPIALVGLLALMSFISLGQRRDDPGPGKDPNASPEGIDSALWDLGKTTFNTCAACHGADGTGLKVGPTLMAPSFIGSETLLGEPDQPILVVLKGILKENADYVGAMAPLGTLSDDQIAGVLSYVRNSWGNQASPITPEQVGAARAKFSDVEAPGGVKRAEIGAILEAHK